MTKNNKNSLTEDLKPSNNLRPLRNQFSLEIIKNIPSLLERIEKDASNSSRIKNKFTEKTYEKLLKKYSRIPLDTVQKPKELVNHIIQDLLGGVPLWRSPNLQYNVGAAVNRVSSTLYALALDLNIFNINDGLAGNAIIAEHAVCQILSELANLDPKKTCGFFTFGGTATNLYAIKIAIAKMDPTSRQDGVPKNINVVITEDSHFSHLNALNWLGIGTKNVTIIKANTGRASDIKDSEKKIKRLIESGKKVPIIIINGGTTYDNTIDDIEKFSRLISSIVKKYKLNYRPHLHVDSVIGWSWLFFKNYNFKKNKHRFDSRTLQSILKQYNKIKKIGLADSWGVDFHKGIGSCPVPCSIIMINDSGQATFLKYNEQPDNHQTAREFSKFSPVDYTLETSRPAGAPLAALGALHSFGEIGFQKHLGNLVQMSQLFRSTIFKKQRSDFEILNASSQGFVTMLRLIPPNLLLTKNPNKGQKNKISQDAETINNYLKEFFKFDNETRINFSKGVEYSFTSKYCTDKSGVKVSALKFYPTSPNISATDIEEAVDMLASQKDIFDKNLYTKI